MIDYAKALNPAQYEAATAGDGPVLVIAGAGSGKTRTIVYRLAWLAEQGVAPAAMLLLTFTRKASQEMLHRASQLLDQGLAGVQGGTFHGFAYTTLRQFRPDWLEGRNFSVMDAADITAAVKHCKEALNVGKGDRSFPKVQNIVGILSKSRNKELPVEEVLRREAFHLLPHAEALTRLQDAYSAYRRTQGLLDYDDLLFELEALLRQNLHAAALLRDRYRYIMVDEYQDTNLVQARIVRLLARPADGATDGAEGDATGDTASGNVMAVGDDAQSIYAFRGANVRNILDFPKFFPGTRVVKLEENYRSTQPVLDVANALLQNAETAFRKQLFTRREGGDPVRMVTPVSDLSQAELLVRRIQELLRDHLPHEIAVLFRAGFHSYHLEMALNRAGIAFRKYGGLRYAEAAHVKDVISFARLCLNPLDMPAFERVAALHSGIGPKTTQKLYTVALGGNAEATEKAFARYPEFLQDMRFLDEQRCKPLSPAAQLMELVDHYRPYLEANYPDDWPRRQQGLEEIIQMASQYQDLDLFVADLALESPEEDENAVDRITLSTVHSSKGLEWGAVLILDLVEDRFPSRHAAARPEDFEEERRLMYVACTRARTQLDLYVPSSVYSRAEQSTVFVSPSPFIRELPSGLCEEWVEQYGGALARRNGGSLSSPSAPSAPSALSRASRLLPSPAFDETSQLDPEDAPEPPAACASLASASGDAASPVRLGYCRHKIFGRGKMVKFLPPDKYQVNFSGFGIKTILAAFLTLED